MALTVIERDAEATPTLPRLSVALAVSEKVPVPEGVNVKLYTPAENTPFPKLVAPLKNATEATVPSGR